MPLTPAIPKTPIETFIVGLDFAPALQKGRSVSFGSVAAYDPTGAVVSNTILLSTSATISGTQALAQVQAGVPGTFYRIVFTVTLDDAEVLQDGLTIAVSSLTAQT